MPLDDDDGSADNQDSTEFNAVDDYLDNVEDALTGDMSGSTDEP